MAKSPKTLTAKDFDKSAQHAFRRIPSKENQIRTDEKLYYHLIEFRPNDVVCQPVGDTRYNYYVPIDQFDPHDSITPEGSPPEDARRRPKNYPDHWLPPKPKYLTAADIMARMTAE